VAHDAAARGLQGCKVGDGEAQAGFKVDAKVACVCLEGGEGEARRHEDEDIENAAGKIGL